MNKNEKSKTTRKAKKRIYVRRRSDQGSLSSETFRLEAEKLRLSEVDFYYDTVNDLLKKKVHDKAPLTYDEELELGSILKLFKGFECENDEAICKSDTCRFAGIPDKWVKYQDFEHLCNLVYNYTVNGPNLDPPEGGDAMGWVWPGDGFCNH